MHSARGSRTTRLYDGSRGNPRGCGKEAQILPKEELEEVNCGADLGNPKPVFISSQLTA